MRRNEGRVVNTPLVFKRVRFSGKKKKEGRERRTRRPVRENGRKVRKRREITDGRRRENGRKGKRERTEGVRDWSEKDDERRWR
ncbi:hypothetical protein TNCV_1608331 [Trichonephila clavipes]|nr:hypothetical protein TNCV_1608331 [Trichonephila clavipes]